VFTQGWQEIQNSDGISNHGNLIYSFKVHYEFFKPVPTAARSEARTLFCRSNTGIVGSNPIRSMDVCPRFSVFLLSYVGTGLESG